MSFDFACDNGRNDNGNLPAIIPSASAVDRARSLTGEHVKAFAEASKARNTRASYAAQWKTFAAWCSATGVAELPAEPETVARFISDRARAGIKPGSISVALSAITDRHKQAGYRDLPGKHPVVRAVLTRIARTYAARAKQASAATAEVIATMVALIPDDLAGLRDRSLLTLGFAGALRRSELVGLDVEHLYFNVHGVDLMLGVTKADQLGTADPLPIPNGRILQPVQALKVWLAASGIESGPVFRPIGKGGRLGAGGCPPSRHRRSCGSGPPPPAWRATGRLIASAAAT